MAIDGSTFPSTSLMKPWLTDRSSPEILLALVETLLTLGQPAGELGPACIIGSGSFNLFAITAVCTASVVGELEMKLSTAEFVFRDDV